MLFLDEETQDKFHKSDTLKQIITGIFDTRLHELGTRLEIIDLEEDRVYAQTEDNLTYSQALELERSINKQFKRNDQRPTVVIQDINLGTWIFLITKSTDISSSH